MVSKQHKRKELLSRASQLGRRVSLGRGLALALCETGKVMEGQDRGAAWVLAVHCLLASCWDWGWSRSLGICGQWAEASALFSPPFSPQQSFFRAAVPQGSFWLQEKQAQPSTALSYAPSFPGSCPSLCPHPAWDGFCKLLALLFAREAAGLVSLGLSRCSPQDLPIAFLWEVAVSHSCTFKAFPDIASEDTLSLFNIFILWVTKENKSSHQHFSACLIKAGHVWQEMRANIWPLKSLYNSYIAFSYLISCLCIRYYVTTFPTRCNASLEDRHLK